MFHLIAVPFVLFSADPVLAGRVYAQVLTLFVALLLYAVTREVGGKLAGAVAVATLLGTPSFVDVSRHYMLEPLLVLEVLAVLYASAGTTTLALAPCPADRGLGLSWTVDQVQLLLLCGAFVYRAGCNRALSRRPRPAALVRRAPERWSNRLNTPSSRRTWYVARATGPMSATGMLNTLYEAGTLKAGLTFDALFEQTFAPLSWNYSGLMQLLALMAAVIYSGSLMGIRVLRSLVGPLSLRQHVLLSSAFVSAVCVPVLLGLVGLGGTLRWHVEAACVFVATFGLLGRLRPAPRIVSISAAAAGAALQLATIYVTPVGAPALLRVPDSGITPRPSAVAIGSETLARDIARHEKRIGGTKPGEFAYFLYHEHAGPHYGTVEFYLRFEGCATGGTHSRIQQPRDRTREIFGAKYLDRRSRRRAGGNGKTRKTNGIADLQRICRRRFSILGSRCRTWRAGSVDSRCTTFPVNASRRHGAQHHRAGRQLETVEPFSILWDAQRVIWRAKFETLTAELIAADRRSTLSVRGFLSLMRPSRRSIVSCSTTTRPESTGFGGASVTTRSASAAHAN